MIGSIDASHPDIELGVERGPLRYHWQLPEAGLDRRTGLVLFMAGYGMDPCGAYAEKLLSHLANRHNCVAASVDYFGADIGAKCSPAPFPDFFLKLAQHYGVRIAASPDLDMARLLVGLAQLLKQNGINRLHDDCQVGFVADEYNSMGLLPALDGLQVVHRLLQEMPLDRRRLFLIGTSYGGYIASMMVKLAPNTFRMAVDNSGFSSADDDPAGVMGLAKVTLSGVQMEWRAVRSWSLDPAAPNFFSPARRAIRDLRLRAHVRDNSARLYAYHAAADTVAPTSEKLRLRQAYDGRVPYDLRIIDADCLDGRVFKTLEHGMKASLRGLFDLSYDKFLADGGALADDTDFDLAAEHCFACGSEAYVVSFSPGAGVRAEIRAS